MIKPEQVSTPELAAYYVDETRAGVMFGLGGAVLAFTGAIQVESNLGSASLGVLSGLALFKGVDYCRQSLAYGRRAKEILANEEDGV